MTRPALRFTGPIASLSAADRAALLDRATAGDEAVTLTVSSIIEMVRRDGDAALHELAREFDGVSSGTLAVPPEACTDALNRLPPAARAAMERTVANLEAVHRAVLPSRVEVEPAPGITVGRRPDPLARVGVYAPGGRSGYPSSVLMGVVPARVAGVREVVLCTPPGRSGRPADAVLAAAALAGVDRVFAVGGAGAIAAMAFGTESVPRVDRIVGPGNAWVTEAKAQVSGVVGIDLLAGPSELLVIADDGADLKAIAREMIAQAEHDPRACVVAILVDGDSAALRETVAANARTTEGTRVIRESLASRGAVLEASSLDEAIAFANAFAPEHLLLAVRDPAEAMVSVRNAGSVFLGETTSVAFGDYATGSNHVLPTGGLARGASGLSTEHFFRWTNYQRVTREAAARLANDVVELATIESLPGHALAAAAWGTQ